MIREREIEEAVASIIVAIGEDPQREGLRDTPQRVARMYADLFAGVADDPADALTTVFEEEDLRDPVVLREVSFFSVCEHHLLPFFGQVHMGYIPSGRVAGASKLIRALEVVARRPQLQERMTAQLADAINTALSPDGVVVVIEAEHLCMVMRGVKNLRSRVLSTATRGSFVGGSLDREGLLALVQGR